MVAGERFVTRHAKCLSLSIRFPLARKIGDIPGTDMPRFVTEPSRPTMTFIDRACNELKVVIIHSTHAQVLKDWFPVMQ
jgi:hypothetical protein